MTHRLTLDIPGEVYVSLQQEAAKTDLTLEQVAAEWLSTKQRRISEDSLLRLAGALEYSAPDVGERHDEHIGEGLRAKQQEDGRG